MTQQQTQTRTAGGVEYTLTRRRVKNINLRVREDGSVAVSAPTRTALKTVDAFVADHRAWIENARQKVAQRQERLNAAPLPTKQEALARFTVLCDHYFPLFEQVLGGLPPVVKVRDMSTRWGVCAPAKRQITFALRLAAMPLPAQEYVVVHEYCHFLVQNHSPAFWAEVEKILPDWKQRRALLR